MGQAHASRPEAFKGECEGDGVSLHARGASTACASLDGRLGNAHRDTDADTDRQADTQTDRHIDRHKQ